MVREILKLKTDNGLGDNNPLFKDIELTEYSFKSPRMGIPTLTAELMWPTCLDDEWTHREYVELRGEKYYIRQVQTSSISNDNIIKYKHSLEFESERERLVRTYFYDVVPSDIHPSNSSGHDKPNTNSTKFTFFGTLREYADRLNCAFRYAGIGDSILNTKTSLTDTDTPTGDGYCVVVSAYGGGDLEQSQELSFEDQWLWDALSEGFNKFKIPFAFHGKKILFNEYVEPISHVFKYGFDNSLLSVKKNNANARIINRITFKGSNENIPYFYPNETEYGKISLKPIAGNSNIPISSFELINPSKLVKALTADERVMLNVDRITQVDFGELSYEIDNKWFPVKANQWVPLDSLGEGVPSILYSTTFSIPSICNIEITGIYGQLWQVNAAAPSANLGEETNLINQGVLVIEGLSNSLNKDFKGSCGFSDNGILMRQLPAGNYTFKFRVVWGNVESDAHWMMGDIKSAVSASEQYYWAVGDKKINNLESIGVRFSGVPNDSMVGGGFQWTDDGGIPFQENLMPPKYRETGGTERFYNALNNTYLKSDGVSYYSFKNPYTEGAPHEYIYTDENIKPTIEGIENPQKELFGVIAGISFDVDDNDSLKSGVGSDEKDKNDSANYAHSFFYIRLNKFNGPNGFDLFNSASQTDPMTIQMTSGKCNGCKFKIQVIESKDGDVEVWSNPVQTLGPDGAIVTGTQSLIINKSNPQEWQQDTTKNYIWIAVQKDAETFGVIMPNRSHNYLPAVGDTFNIINIDLPQGYIDYAEERGEKAMLDFMENNNEEKFNFEISASRIFFAENPSVLASLNENSRIKIEYDNKIYEQYVAEFGIDCKNGEVLPDIKLTLANTLEPSGSFVEEVVAQAADLAGASTRVRGTGTQGGLTTELADLRYIRKDKDDRTEHRISSDTGFEVGDFVSGSSGGIMFVDPETGKSTLEVDYFKARIKAIFETLEVAHVRSIGGKLTITPGGSITISFVEEFEESYRCYFKQQEEDKGADCRFIVGDDVICQSFNVSNGTTEQATNKFYWRAVTAVSNEDSYVELSKTDCAANSDVPEIGDTICQLGSDDVSRQSAIILSTVDTFSPNITLYDGVTDFTLNGKEMVDMGVDQTTNKAYFHVYGNAYVGDKDGVSYLKYDNLLKLLEIKAKLSVGSTVGDDSLEDYIKKVSPPVEQEDIEGFVNATVDLKIEGLQKQIDGVIETWFYNGVPTLDNYPASGWNTPDLKIQHLGDLYYDNDTGTAYRFSQNAQGGYYWNVITDDAITKALAAAQAAQDTADGKRRVFTSQPTTPYDKGDLWVNATYPVGTTTETRDPEKGKYYNDILRCSESRATGAFNIAEWGLSSNYTDDTKANEALNQIAGYEYLKKALGDVTTIAGGLMLSSQIRLGEHNADFTTQTTWSGHNGVYVNGRSIGSWWGGDMLDLFDANDVKQSFTSLQRPAQSLIRMDGSAYFAGGNIGFRKDGSGWLGNDLTGIKFDSSGTMTFGSGVKIDVTSNSGVQQTLEDIANFNIGLSALLTPCAADGTQLTWAEAAQSDGMGGIKAKSLKSLVGFWSVDFVSAKGKSTGGGGTSGGGLIQNVYGSSSLGGVFSDSTLTDTFNAYTINKINNDLSTRITALENGGSLSALNVMQTGTGNAVTEISLSADKKTLTATRGQTFLTQASLANYYTKTESNSLFIAHTVYNYGSGCLIKLRTKANIDTMVTLLIEGNSNIKKVPILTRVQFYNYNSGNYMGNPGATHYGAPFGDINVFNYDGYIYVWFKPNDVYQTFSITAICSASGYYIGNAVDTIQNAQMPTEGVTRLVTITPKIGLRSDNYTSILDGRYYTESEIDTKLTDYVKKAGDTMTGALLIKSSGNNSFNEGIRVYSNNNWSSIMLLGSDTTEDTGTSAKSWGLFNHDGDFYLSKNGSGANANSLANIGGEWRANNHTLWHEGNDGTGSGLDADLLDGIHASAFARGGFVTYGNFKAGWVRIAECQSTASGIISIDNTYSHIPNSGVTILVHASYRAHTQTHGSIVQIGGTNKLFTKARIVYSPTSIVSPSYIEVYQQQDRPSSLHISMADSLNITLMDSYTAGSVPEGYGTKEIDLVEGISVKEVKANSFTGALNGNATSATMLQTSRTLWGQSFDGTGNVSGDMTSVGTIYCQGSAGSYREGLRIKPYNHFATIVLGGDDLLEDSGTSQNTWSIHNNNGNFYINKFNATGATAARAWATSTGWTFGNTSTNTYALNAASFICDSWVRTKDATGWLNETYGGGWYMNDSTWVKMYGSKSLYLESGQIRCDGYFNREGYAGNSFNYGVGAYNVAIVNNASQTPIIVAHREGFNAGVSGVNRLFAMELYNTGTQLRFGFGGDSKFIFKSEGVFYATTGMYSDGYMTAKVANSSSDKRLKTNIRDICVPLTDIVNAPSVIFDWKDGKGRGAGTLAQYWLNRLPDVVRTDPHGFYTVSYGVLAHIEAVSLAKHLTKRIDSTEAKIRRLESRIIELERKIQK